MPDVQEVFRMATEKVRQDPGALDRQVTKQHKVQRNRRIGAFATVLVLIAVVAGIYALSHSGTREVPAHPSSPVQIAPGATSGTMVDLSTGSVTALPAKLASVAATYYAMSPDQGRIAYSVCCNKPSPLYVSNADGTHVHVVSRPGWDAFGAQWSPDGSMLVYQQRHQESLHLGDLIIVVPGRPNERTQITHLDRSPRWGWWFMFPSFSADGRSVLFQMPRGDGNEWDLWSVPVTGGQPTIVRRDVGWGAYSPDGMSLAYIAPMDQSFSGEKLWIAPLSGGSPVAVATGHLSWARWSPDGTKISYSGGDGYVHVFDLASGKNTRIALGQNAEWADDHTLIVGYGGT